MKTLHFYKNKLLDKNIEKDYITNMAKLTKTEGRKGKCPLCGINLYVETGNKPSPKAMPCGIDRTEVKGSAEGAGQRCPYETEKEQRTNFAVRKVEKAGEGQIWYEGGMEF